VRRQGIGNCANQFHHYRLTMDSRTGWGGYDAVYDFGRKIDATCEDRLATYRELVAGSSRSRCGTPQHFLRTVDALGLVRFLTRVTRCSHGV
jgi:hypothetical protein